MPDDVSEILSNDDVPDNDFDHDGQEDLEGVTANEPDDGTAGSDPDSSSNNVDPNDPGEAVEPNPDVDDSDDEVNDRPDIPDEEIADDPYHNPRNVAEDEVDPADWPDSPVTETQDIRFRK